MRPLRPRRIGQSRRPSERRAQQGDHPRRAIVRAKARSGRREDQRACDRGLCRRHAAFPRSRRTADPRQDRVRDARTAHLGSNPDDRINRWKQGEVWAGRRNDPVPRRKPRPGSHTLGVRDARTPAFTGERGSLKRSRTFAVVIRRCKNNENTANRPLSRSPDPCSPIPDLRLPLRCKNSENTANRSLSRRPDPRSPSPDLRRPLRCKNSENTANRPLSRRPDPRSPGPDLRRPLRCKNNENTANRPLSRRPDPRSPSPDLRRLLRC